MRLSELLNRKVVTESGAASAASTTSAARSRTDACA